MIRRPPRSTLSSSSAASDVYKRQLYGFVKGDVRFNVQKWCEEASKKINYLVGKNITPVSYTHLRAHETGRNLVCRLLLEKKKKKNTTMKHT